MAKVEAETVGYIFATQTEILLVKFLSITTLIGFLFNSESNPIKLLSFLTEFREHYLKISYDRIIPTKRMIVLSHF